jgi:predicted RNA-binding Zn-ribbon protein involved in translation (DUF1610 family)
MPLAKISTLEELYRRLSEIVKTESFPNVVEGIKGDWKELSEEEKNKLIKNGGKCPNCGGKIEKVLEIMPSHWRTSYYLMCERGDWKGVYNRSIVAILKDDTSKRFDRLFEELWDKTKSKGIILGECAYTGGELKLLGCNCLTDIRPTFSDYKIECSNCGDINIDTLNMIWRYTMSGGKSKTYFCPKKINK